LHCLPEVVTNDRDIMTEVRLVALELTPRASLLVDGSSGGASVPGIVLDGSQLLRWTQGVHKVDFDPSRHPCFGGCQTI
jgi:hypothetical protein